jgi:hypothetical protein
MSGERVLYTKNFLHKGRQEISIGIRKPLYDHNEIFMFDGSTGEVYLRKYRNLILAVQTGRNNRGAHLVVVNRRFRNGANDSKWWYRPAQFHNWSPFSNKGLCMDVSGGRDVDGQDVIMWSCHNGANQRFDATYNV